MVEARSSEPRSERLQVGAPIVIGRETPGGTPIVSHPDDVFFAAVQLSPVPMIVSDPRQDDNPVVFANAAFQIVTGYGDDEIIGRNCRFLQGADTDPKTVREFRAAIAAKRPFSTEILNYRKDGSWFWNALSVSPLFNDAGELVYFFGTQQDVSHRREVEEALRLARLPGSSERHTGLAHDFNNLLQVIVGYLELIRTGLAKPDIQRDRLMRSVDNSRDAAARATALAQQFLSASRKRRATDHPEAAETTADDAVQAASDRHGEDNH